MRGKWVFPAVAAAVVAAGISVVALRNRRKPPPPPTSAAVVVEQDGITLQGAIRPQHMVTVGASVNGIIESFLVEIGEEVFQGQALARIGSSGLDSAKENAVEALEKAQDQVSKLESALNAARLEASRAEADAQRAKSQLDRTQRVFERQNTLYREGATPKQAYEKAMLEFEAATKEHEIMDKAGRSARDNVQSVVDRLGAARTAIVEKQEELRAAESDYSEAEVRAPVDGTVVGRSGETGKPADEAGDKMFQIATDMFALEVPLEAKPEILKRIHPGQSATVMVLDIPNMSLPGTVKEVKETEVVVEFQNHLLGVRPGMRVDVRFRFE